MRVQILDLDGGLLPQHGLRSRLKSPVVPLQHWGPRIRLGCTFARYRRFEAALTELLGDEAGAEPELTYYGSGDFHHVSLALLKRIRTPFNLLVLDNHPDWMRGLPFLHCGTWLYHAAQLPQVRRIFHVGGTTDFDNYYRWLAPWGMLGSRRIVVLPAVHKYRRGRWKEVDTAPLRCEPDSPFPAERLEALIAPHRKELRTWPLYVSVDKDVMVAQDAAVNWDSGRLTLEEVEKVLRTFAAAARGNFAGIDVLGDWSEVRVSGWFRRLLHVTEHEPLAVHPAEAAASNQRANLALLRAAVESPRRWQQRLRFRRAA